MAGKKVSFASMADDPVVDEPGIDPNNNPVAEGPARWVLTENCRYNPRNPRDLGDLDDPDTIDVSDLESIADKQLQSCLGVTPQAYLKLWPEDEPRLRLNGPDNVVIINGNRRLLAASKYGQPKLIVVVDDSHAESKTKLLRAALDENMSRVDFDPIEEARGVMQIVSEYPTAKDAAEAEGWSPTWITQRKSLLKLHPDLQQMVRAKARGGEGIAIRHARAIGSTPGIEQLAAEQQIAILHQLIDAEAEAALERKRIREEKKAARTKAQQSAVNAEAATAPSGLGEETPAPSASAGTAAAVGFSMENRPTADPADPGPQTSAPNPGTDGPAEPAAVGTRADEFSMENRPAAAAPGDSEVPEQRATSPASAGTAGLGLPDWRDLDSVAGWICRFLPPDEARVVAQTVLNKVEELEHRSSTAAR
ncbi:hypothetical protein ACPC54_37345 [Kitasatospora sp. NPDC094028]